MIEQLHEMQAANDEPLTEFASEEIWQVGTDPVTAGPTASWTMAEAECNTAVDKTSEAPPENNSAGQGRSRWRSFE